MLKYYSSKAFVTKVVTAVRPMNPSLNATDSKEEKYNDYLV